MYGITMLYALNFTRQRHINETDDLPSDMTMTSLGFAAGEKQARSFALGRGNSTAGQTFTLQDLNTSSLSSSATVQGQLSLPTVTETQKALHRAFCRSLSSATTAQQVSACRDGATEPQLPHEQSNNSSWPFVLPVSGPSMGPSLSLSIGNNAPATDPSIPTSLHLYPSRMSSRASKATSSKSSIFGAS